jgi:hypothetical protein
VQIIPSSVRGKRETRACLNEIELFNFQTGCIFNDHSLITLEEGKFHSRLREYKIDYKSTHILLPRKDLICKVKSSVTCLSQMRVTRRGDTVVVIICNKNATVEFIKAVPRG